MQIKTIIFDIGKVLVEFDWKYYIECHGYSDNMNQELAETLFLNNLWKERDRGGKTEEEYIRLFIEESPHLEKEIRELFENIIDIVEVYPFSNEWLKNLKNQGYGIYLLSNYSKASFENDRKKFDFLEYVDGKIISYEIQSVKPEPTIYKELLEKYNINPKEAIFLDDLEDNLEMAKSFGINTIHVTSHQSALDGLEKYGIR